MWKENLGRIIQEEAKYSEELNSGISEEEAKLLSSLGN